MNIINSNEQQTEDKISLGVKILETQEIERKRIAMDLHDSSIQNMTAVIHKIELCSILLDKDIDRVRDELSNVGNEIRMIIGEMRDIVYNLQPISLIDMGLSSAINRMIEKNNCNNSTKIVFKEKGNKLKISTNQEITIYRVIQEACNNSLAYANAKLISIDINYNKNTIEINITDDGNGFIIDNDIENSERIIQAKSEGHGYGIAIMRERVYLMNGKFNIKSDINKGTKINIIIPAHSGDGEGGNTNETDKNHNC